MPRPLRSGMYSRTLRETWREPRAAAIVVGTCTLSYGEVNRRANQLARYLRRLVWEETRLSVFMTRGAELIISMLATSAGGAYVPVDPAYPPERVEYMAKDSGMTVLLTLSQLIEDAHTISKIPLCLTLQTIVRVSSPRVTRTRKSVFGFWRSIALE